MHYGCLRVGNSFFLQHSKGIRYHYATLFKEEGEETETKTKTIGSKWGWYQIIHSLAQGDITKMEDVEKLYIDVALTYLSYEKDLELRDKIKM